MNEEPDVPLSVGPDDVATTEEVAGWLDAWRAGRRGTDVPDPPVGRDPRRAWLTNAAGLIRSWGVEPLPDVRGASGMRLWPTRDVLEAIAVARGPGGSHSGG